ncbi:MAG: hypothetical protein QOE89_2117 [Pseudonocardiales bacterium]|jgi:uncharacterized protein (TIGR02246 family)|nr:hypothetical protein [Pseudonocardiales bacterium]
MEPTDLVERLTDAFNTKNPTAFAELFTEDAEFVNSFGPRMRRRDGIARGHQIGFDKLLAGSRMTVSAVDVMHLGDDVAMMHASWNRERLSDATPATLPPGSGILTFVARRTDPDSWQLVGATNVQDAVPPGAPAL